MMRFENWLFETEEVAATKRQDMIHFQKMKPLEFVEFALQVKNEFKGKLTNLKSAMKVDGLGARFGRSEQGLPFFEGSRTGPIFQPNAFTNYAKSRGSNDEIMLRAGHYDDIWEIITKSKQMKVVPPGAKVICEIFYNPMATIHEDGITFVTVKYDKSKLGSLMSIVPFAVVDAKTGQPHPGEAKILKDLFKTSDDKIKVIDSSLKMGTIDFHGLIDPIATLTPEMLSKVKSLKHADKEDKANTLAVIQGVKDGMADYILHHPEIYDKFKLGPEIEGLVLTINNREYKITTQKFKDSKKK